jgi:hypothetical protein
MDQISIKTPNPKCRIFFKIDQQSYLAAGFHLSEARDHLPSPPPVTHCMNTYPCTYSHRGGGLGEPVRRLEGGLFTRGVKDTNMTDCISNL